MRDREREREREEFVIHMVMNISAYVCGTSSIRNLHFMKIIKDQLLIIA